MGEAKRRRERGDAPVSAQQFVDHANWTLGCEVWSPMSEEVDRDFRWAYLIREDGEFGGIIDLMSPEGERLVAQEHRAVLTLLMRGGVPWVGALVVDLCREYKLSVHERIAEDAIAMLSKVRGSRSGVPVRHLVARSTFRDPEGEPSENLTIVTDGESLSPEGGRQIFDLHETEAVGEEQVAFLVSCGWPEPTLRELLEDRAMLGEVPRISRARRSILVANIPGMELTWVNGRVKMDLWVEGSGR